MSTQKPKFKGGKREKEQEKNEIFQSFYAEDGDIILVSSDDVHFKIHSFYLQAASSVFRDMITTGCLLTRKDETPIHLSDPDIETSQILEVFLGIICNRSTPSPSRESINLLSKVLELLKKYECGAHMEKISLALRHWLRDSTFLGLDIFIIAAKADDLETCLVCINERFYETWDTYELGYHPRISQFRLDNMERVLDRPTPRASMFDASAMSFTLYSSLPLNYMWALSKACQGLNLTPSKINASSWNMMSDRFEALVRDTRG